jgi:hypothetical protein
MCTLNVTCSQIMNIYEQELWVFFRTFDTYIIGNIDLHALCKELCILHLTAISK